jgi:agmatinase
MPDDYPLNMPYVGIPTFCRFPYRDYRGEINADFAILGIPFDEGASWRAGMRFAPRRIRDMSLRYASRANLARAFFQGETGRYFLADEIANDRIVDCGDVDIIYTRIKDSFANMTAAVRAIRHAGAMPVVFGGDHAITPHVVKAYDESPIDLLVLDAHLDWADSLKGIRWAGMSPIRRASELKNVRNIVHFGIHGIRNPKVYWDNAVKRGNLIITTREFRADGVAKSLDRLPDLENLYITIDMDAYDPSVAPGVNGIEAGGLLYPDTLDFLGGAIERANRVIGIDINEVNPILDMSDYTSLIAAQLAIELMGEVSFANKRG